MHLLQTVCVKGSLKTDIVCKNTATLVLLHVHRTIYKQLATLNAAGNDGRLDVLMVETAKCCHIYIQLYPLV